MLLPFLAGKSTVPCFYISSWLSHLNSNCFPFSISYSSKDAHQCINGQLRSPPLTWSRQKDCVITSIATFTVLYLMVGPGQGFGVSVQPPCTEWERSTLQVHTSCGCITISSLFQRSGADLKQTSWSFLLISHCFRSQGSFHTHKLDFSKKSYIVQPIVWTNGSEPVTASCRQVHVACGAGVKPRG